MCWKIRELLGLWRNYRLKLISRCEESKCMFMEKKLAKKLAKRTGFLHLSGHHRAG